MTDIDFVITWVDGSDEKWQKEKQKYAKERSSDSHSVRYRDMNNLKYLFRSIEKNASWVNKIHFVTEGHLPDFLKTNHPKLNIVSHEDYIPSEYLPTFSSHPIELNLHRIEGLSEKFVYFNDDIFITQATSPEDFFINGLPADQAQLDYVSSDKGTIFPHILLNNVDLLNQNFNKKQVLKTHRSKWFSTKYGIKACLKNLYFAPMGNFSGIKWHHLPVPYLKSTFDQVWAKNYDVLHATSLNKFRSASDINQYVFRNWQFCTGQFEPKSIDKFGKFYNMPHLENSFYEDIKNNKYKISCVNDSAEVSDFEDMVIRINTVLDEHFPEKSSFEI